jgi:hypothetical protein
VTLGVSSPPATGREVKKAQQVLNGGNVFGRDFLLGSVDGIFGEETGRACIRAKFWLGYPTQDLKPTYGEHLNGFLKGLEQPSAEMIKRTAARQKKAKQKPLGEKALTEARKHLGVKESPAGSNKVLFSDWYGIRGPWCAMFVSYCYVKAGSKAFAKGKNYAYCPYIVNDARAGRNSLSVTRSPKPGDIVLYDWDGGVADHVGLFEKWKVEGSSFYAIEGNTSVSDNSNGGQVMQRQRDVRQVECFVRVGR